MNPFVLGKNPDGTPKRCGDGSFPFENPTGRCPEDREAPITGGGQGDPDTGSPPLGGYTGVGQEGEDACSNPAYAILNPTLCGPQRETLPTRPDLQKTACLSRGGQWNKWKNSGKGLCMERTGPGTTEWGGLEDRVGQKPCWDGSYPRDHEGGVCPVQRRKTPGGSPDQNPANIPGGPGFEGGWG